MAACPSYLRANATSTLNNMPVCSGDNMEKQPLNLTPRYNLEFKINLMWMSLDCGEEAVVHRENRHTGAGRTCKLHSERLQVGI